MSGSHTSVSGPAAGLTAVVATQLDQLGSFEAFLLAVVIGGVIQVGLGLVKAGSLSSFFPSSVIKGLLAAIGVILILKQIPHLVGDDNDVEGDMAFLQPDEKNTFTELAAIFQGEWHQGCDHRWCFVHCCLVAVGTCELLEEIVAPRSSGGRCLWRSDQHRLQTI